MAASSTHGADTAQRMATSATPGATLPPAAPGRREGLSDQVVVLLLADVQPASRLWGYARFVLGGWPLRHVPGLRFSRQLGSGHEGGFGLRPSGTRQGLFLLFDNAADADAFADHSPVLAAYRARASELCLVRLRAYSSRGSWGGAQLLPSAAPPLQGPVAALTRASIRPSRALRFWRMAPPAQASLEAARGCRMAVGLGEAPLLRQATFSLWDNEDAMNAYARTGAHHDAIRAAVQGRYFSESMFVRFVPESVRGQWKGVQHG